MNANNNKSINNLENETPTNTTTTSSILTIENNENSSQDKDLANTRSSSITESDQMTTSTLSTLSLNINDNDDQVLSTNSSSSSSPSFNSNKVSKKMDSSSSSSIIDENELKSSSNNNNNEEMLNIYKQLEHQQLANKILINQIASLKQQQQIMQITRTPNSTPTSSLISIGAAHFGSNSLPPTPTPTNQPIPAEALIQSLLNLNSETVTCKKSISKDDSAIPNNLCSNVSFSTNLSSNSLFNIKKREEEPITSSKITTDNRKTIIKSNHKYDTNKLTKIIGKLKANNKSINHIYKTKSNKQSDVKNSKKFLKLSNGNNTAVGVSKKSFHHSSSSSRLNSGRLLRDKNLNNVENLILPETVSATCNNSNSSNCNDNNSSGQIVKTPKSALLEKRRKAVFELLTDEIYPSGNFYFIN
jgi:hypothetical protein